MVVLVIKGGGAGMEAAVITGNLFKDRVLYSPDWP